MKKCLKCMNKLLNIKIQELFFPKSAIIGSALILLVFLAGFAKNVPDKMAWWHEAKFGMFIHWGIYSVPAGTYQGSPVGRYGEWIMHVGRIPVAEYAAFARQFNPVDFDAEAWVKLAKDAGMKYIVITAKHHDGFALFDSKATEFDVIDATPFKRDIIGEMAVACKNLGMPLGLYYSQAQDWHHPGGAAMGGHWDPAQEGSMDQYIDEVAVPQVDEILSNYGYIKILWWDTPTNMNEERALRFMPVLAEHPDLIYNDRLGGGIKGDLKTPEQHIPATGIPGVQWESCMTMNYSWGYNKNDTNWKSSETLVRNLIDIASKGGNYLLNVGPTAQGIIPEASVVRLKEIGNWMKVNGEAIYGTTASPFSFLPWGRCTVKKKDGKNLLYLHVFELPGMNEVFVDGLASKVNTVYALNNPTYELEYSQTYNRLEISTRDVAPDPYATVIVLETKDDIVVYHAPEILPEASVFLNEVSFKISTDIPNAIVRYTTDGSIPDTRSPLAGQNVTLRPEQSFVLKAMCFVDGKAVSGIAEHVFEKAEPREPVSLKDTQKGLRYVYYEGLWNDLPDFSILEPVDKGVVPVLNLSMKKRNIDFGVTYAGCIEVPETAVYHFILASNDGSKMTIAGKTLVQDGIQYGMAEETLEVALQKGAHIIQVEYFQAYGGSALDLKWKIKGHDPMEIPVDWYLFEK